MRRFLPLALLLAAACGPTREWVPVEVNWTFGGKSCADAGVDSIQIDVEGEILTPNKFTCQQADLGADLGEWITGPYTWTVTGFDAAGNIIFQTTQAVQIHRGGKNVIPFDAAPTTGDVAITWTFAGQTCAAAGVSSVRVSIDGQVITDAQNNPDLPCSSTHGDGTLIGPLQPGAHTLALAARGSSADYAIDNVAFNIAAGQETPLGANLAVAAPTTASADVRWTFGAGKSCADVGVDHIWVYFDPPATGSWGASIADVACAGLGGAPVTSIDIVDVPDGNHRFAIRGTRVNQLLYYTHNPQAYPFAAPFTTVVNVTAEPLP